jgi:hypothetical protein
MIRKSDSALTFVFIAGLVDIGRSDAVSWHLSRRGVANNRRGH